MRPHARAIVLINGHPDARPERLCTALCDAYAAGATAAGHTVRRIDVGALEFPLIRTKAEFEAEAPPPFGEIQAQLLACDHVVIVHPLWLGAQPAQLRGFLEQVFRHGAIFGPLGGSLRGRLKGKSARVVVTMGMPAPVFRWVFGAHGLKSLEQGVLWLAGLGPISRLILGGVEGPARRRVRWLARMRRLGARGA